jgi:TrmH family RNA methyltransferase
MGVITSRHNPLYRALLDLRKDRDVMLLEGRRIVADALSRGCTPRMAAVTRDFLNESDVSVQPDMVLSDPLFAAVAQTETPQGILAFFEVPWASMDEVADIERVVVLDGLQDPGNVGTIVRTAEAFGFDGMVVLGGTASPFSPKAVRASMGSCLGIRISRGTPADLKRLPHRLLALSSQGGTRLSADLFRNKIAVCLGQEASGIGEEVLALCHDTVAIPMTGRTESLNVAVTAGIVMACAAGVMAD